MHNKYLLGYKIKHEQGNNVPTIVTFALYF